jgi:hypothetical protein
MQEMEKAATQQHSVKTLPTEFAASREDCWRNIAITLI